MNQVFSKTLQQEKLDVGPVHFRDESKILVNAIGASNRGYSREEGKCQ